MDAAVATGWLKNGWSKNRSSRCGIDVSPALYPSGLAFFLSQRIPKPGIGNDPQEYKLGALSGRGSPIPLPLREREGPGAQRREGEGYRAAQEFSGRRLR